MLITLADAARKYGIPRRKLQHAVDMGRLKAVKRKAPVRYGRQVIFRPVNMLCEEEVVAFLNRGEERRTSVGNGRYVYLDYKKAGRIPPHFLTAFHVYVRAVASGFDLTGTNAVVTRVAHMIRMVDTDAEAMALEATGANVRW